MGILLEPPSKTALGLAARGLLSLTQSEYLVLRALLAGMDSNEIAMETGLAKLTVQFYLKVIFRKCNCDRLALVRMAPKLERDGGVMRHLTSLASMTRRSKGPTLKLGVKEAAAEPPRTRKNGTNPSEKGAGPIRKGRPAFIDRRPFSRRLRTGH